MNALRFLPATAILLAATSLAHAQAPLANGSAVLPVEFVRDVQPILRERCHRCHGGVKREGGLSLLTRTDALASLPSGERAVVSGKPEESELLRRVAAVDPAERMPPDGEPLTAAEMDRLRRWIALGAAWERHWSFQPIRRPELPPVVDQAWVRSPIDRFVLSRLETASVAPSPEADRFTLIRRLYLDLLGLPPGIEDIAAFCSDTSPGAYERLVERLLASPHFGERWGRHWLDQARYADTDGFEVDGPRKTAWLWRDWVIGALNADMPFDQFTLEQIAGDLLPDATPSQRLATGFHRQSLTNKEGGIDRGEARYRELVDRVNALGTIWLGMTVGCAQCHHHPYDPIMQREFYALFAFFNQTEDTELRIPPAALEDSVQETSRRAGKTAESAALVVSQAKEPRATTLYHRGDFLRPGDVVQSGTFRELPGLPRRLDGSAEPNRLDLASWLVDSENPLMPRVAANQLWIRLFGAGLVRTPDDFGARGESPTDGRLLDWLADEYRRSGWSIKHLIRLVVRSATYRQSSRHRPELQSVDPLNELWHRQNRYRVEAELVRDLGLSAAGLLTSRVGGPGCYPPLPEEVARLSFRSNYVWTESRGSDRYRRGMYIFYKRTLPHPNLDTFDCPDATAPRMQRESSNTPLQALTALNNEVFVEAAQALAQRILAVTHPTDTDEVRIDYVFRLCLGRPATVAERETLHDLLAVNRRWYAEQVEEAGELVGSYGAAEVDPSEAAAWVALCNVVLNLDEFLTRE